MEGSRFGACPTTSLSYFKARTGPENSKAGGSRERFAGMHSLSVLSGGGSSISRFLEAHFGDDYLTYLLRTGRQVFRFSGCARLKMRPFHPNLGRGSVGASSRSSAASR